MPYKIQKIRNKNLYKVYNTWTGRIHSKGTTMDKAKSQVRLLHQIEGNGVYDNYPKLQQSLTIGNGLYYKFK